MSFEKVISIKNIDNAEFWWLSKSISQTVTSTNKCTLETSDTNIRVGLEAIHLISSKTTQRNASKQYVRNLILTSQKTHCIYITKITRSMVASKRFPFTRKKDLSTVKHSQYTLRNLLWQKFSTYFVQLEAINIKKFTQFYEYYIVYNACLSFILMSWIRPN